MSLEQWLRDKSLFGDQSCRDLLPRKPILKLERGQDPRISVSSTDDLYAASRSKKDSLPSNPAVLPQQERLKILSFSEFRDLQLKPCEAARDSRTCTSGPLHPPGSGDGPLCPSLRGAHTILVVKDHGGVGPLSMSWESSPFCLLD